ncbi:hypothetical protein KDL01_25315 [Actinospica durhamensis]|uniref:Uncharacterized protein n=1 Tax=Actinospica durhamensis TaxID=1508375 RepID=A0A941IQT7_9ACTN|nr:hypothetical protein [Actinospica durhamensis]MBR7836624.1 hypothetical protein [Actinospica durhamensis]
MASSRSRPRKPAQAPGQGGASAKQKAATRPADPAALTAAEQAARDTELAEAHSRAVRRLVIALCVLAVPFYIWAALVISSHNK